MSNSSLKLTDYLWVTLCVLLASFIRLDLLYTNNFVIDSDEAIVGLMAMHINEGRGIPTFYYGQHYMGALEPLSVALMFKLFGVSSLVLKLTPFLYSLLLIPITFALTSRLVSRQGAWIATGYLALGPATLHVWSSMARGGFIELLVIGSLSLLLLSKWVLEPKPKLLTLFMLGLLLGLGWWTNNQIVFFMLPTALFCLIKIIGDPRFSGIRLVSFVKQFIIGTLGFLIGSFPYWQYNIRNDFASFGMFSLVSSSDALTHFAGVVSLSLPIIFGSKRFWQMEDVFPAASLWIYFSLLLVSILVFVAWFKESSSKSNRFASSLIVIFFVTCLGIFSFSTYGFLVEAPRYLLPLYCLAPVALALACEQISAISRVVFLTTILILNLNSLYLGGRAIPGEPFIAFGQRASKDHSELIAWLNEQQITLVNTNYWIGYRLAFETQEKVRFHMFQEPWQIRLPEYQKVKPLTPAPYVLVPAQEYLVTSALEAHAVSFERTEKSGYVILYNLSEIAQITGERVPSQLVKVFANIGQDTVHLANDGLLETRWATASPQRAGQQFVVEFEQATHITGVLLNLGKFLHDYPRGLKVKAYFEDGNSQVVLSPKQYKGLRYLPNNHNGLSLPFDLESVVKLEFTQTGEDPIFDWTIAEIEVYYKT